VRRGELYTYVRPSAPANRGTVVVLSSDGINEAARDWVLGVQLRENDPDDLLAVPVGDGRFAYVGDLNRLYRSWIGRRTGRLDTMTLSRLDNVLRAVLDL
jgi:mRNA-degrading endonuclease toxin of MazEF toxin-antitoxin module